MKKLVGAVASCTVVTLAATGIAVTDAAAGSPDIRTSRVQHIDWDSCKDQELRTANAQCGFVSVPRNYHRPNGKKIKIAISRIKATAPKSERQGVMLTNTGGPGVSGLYLATLGASVPDGVGGLYDWIGIDTRGVGENRPNLTCVPGYFQGPRPAYEPLRRSSIGGNERAWIRRSKNYAKACARKNGPLLEHMHTEDLARDLDVIRAALGERRLNFYGFSYGTYLAQVYATLFPHRVRRMVLDGNLAPDGVGYGDGGLQQMVGFERVMAKFWHWVARYEEQFGLGDSAKEVEALYYDVEDDLREHPVGGIGSAEWNDAFLPAGYTEDAWVDVAQAFKDWRHGNHDGIRDLYRKQTGSESEYASFLATICSEGDWPRGDYDAVRHDVFKIARRAPFLTWGGHWFSAPCLWWPVKPADEVEVDGSHTRPLLLVNATLDGATPFTGALKVRREFRRSALVAEVGATTHAGSLRGNPCVDDTIARYLRTGDLPDRRSGNRADLRCPRLPRPVPDGA
jgi:pimeloyl-ACP methyl ester carboxylesterase